MINRSATGAALWLAAAAGPAVAQGVPTWSFAQASEPGQASALAVSRKEQILWWGTGEPARAATVVHGLVDAPFAAVQPAVAKALQAFGHFEASVYYDPLAYQIDGWDTVLLSRRPDLRDALAARFAQPRLELAREVGALTVAEFEERLAQARASTEFVPQDRAELAAFKAPTLRFYATQSATHGWLGRSHSTLSVNVFDMSAAFGRPTTGVRVSRRDESPNPDYSVFGALRNFNILGGGYEPKTLTGAVVPATVFQAVHAVLVSVSASDRVQFAPNPQAWAEAIEPPARAPAIQLVPPGRDRPALAATLLPWDAVAGLSRELTIYMRGLLVLPNGDVVVSARDHTHARVWRVRQAERAWKSEQVWEGSDGAHQLALSADGRTVWFDGTEGLVAYDVQARQTLAYSPQLLGDKRSKSREPRRWELLGSQGPAYLDHSYSMEGSPLGSHAFLVIEPTAPAPPAGGAWAFRHTLSAARQSMMTVPLKGNHQIWPVLWRDPSSMWVEDATGIAELQAGSGRVLRAHRVPQRFGEIDRRDASGVAQWVPKPLGSPQGGWIALGFVLLLSDENRQAPSGHERQVGMHVIRVADGRVCLSALLGRSDVLRAAARSANGQWLALGSEGVSPNAGGVAALWDTQTCQPAMRLALPEGAGSLHALAFSWDGAELWASTRRGLLRWRMPEGLRDAARAGSFPEQSRY